jgi:hypothetical protein
VVNPIVAESIAFAVKLEVKKVLARPLIDDACNSVKLPAFDVTCPIGPVMVDAVSIVKLPRLDVCCPIGVLSMPPVAVNELVAKVVVDKLVKRAVFGSPNPIGGGLSHV